jgi:Protein of unknown function (DUF2804)
MSRLPAAPDAITSTDGTPHFGTFEGGFARADLGRLSGRYQLPFHQQVLKHKKWLYSFVATPEVIALQAVVDVGYASNAFCTVVDLRDGTVLVDESFMGPPRPLVTVNDCAGPGLDVSFRVPGASMKASRQAGNDRYQWHTRLGALRTKLTLDCELLAAGTAPPLTLVAPVEGDGRINITQKWAGLLSFGTLEAKGRRFTLDGGVGGLDSTNGYLARHTAWRWGFGCGRLADGSPLGFNCVEGFNETRDDVNENGLWLGGRLYPLGRARFSYNKADVLDPWQLSTTDGALELTFKPVAAHRESRDLKLVKSWFVQPIGTWEGRVTIEGQTHAVRALPGVSEDQDILW